MCRSATTIAAAHTSAPAPQATTAERSAGRASGSSSTVQAPAVTASTTGTRRDQPGRSPPPAAGRRNSASTAPASQPAAIAVNEAVTRCSGSARANPARCPAATPDARHRRVCVR